MTTDLLLHAARMATARAHLAGAEAAELARLVQAARALIPEPPDLIAALAHPGGITGATDDFLEIWAPAWDAYCLAWRGATAARRRYWRECAAAATLAGWSWPEAEKLGREGL